MFMADEFGPDYGQFLKELGARIKLLRNERGLSLRDMIVTHGYADSQWRRYERGGSVNVQTLLRICNAFKISLCVLLDGLGEYPAASVDEIKHKQQSETKSVSVKKKAAAPKSQSSSPASTRKTSKPTDSGGANSSV
jgi:transcriptional regulator with XRE-family HTH domain